MVREHWREVALLDVIDVKHGFAFSGENIKDEPPGEILLTPGNFAIGGGFKGDKFKYFDGKVPEEFVLDEDDLVVTMTDLSKQADTLGYPALVPKSEGGRFLHNQRLGKILIRQGAELDKRFLSYLLRTPGYRNEVLAGATGTTVKHTSPGRILAYKTSIPPLPEQRAIAQFLGTLDEKIVLNRQTGETEAAISRALFLSWIVNFDPVRDKAEGRDPCLPRQLADMFPDSLEESELGAIPKGWKVCNLDEIARFLNGLALQNYPPRDGESLPVIKIAQLRAGNSRGADLATSDLEPNYVVNDGDVLFSWSGSLECVLWAGGRGALNQHLFKVTSSQYSKWFYYEWIHNHLSTFRHIAAGKATTMGHIQRHHLAEAKTVVPPPELRHALDGVFAPLIDGIWRRAVQSRTLSALRDILLPKLVSGDISVKEAEGYAGRNT